jgi:hypothetical protein
VSLTIHSHTHTAVFVFKEERMLLRQCARLLVASLLTMLAVVPARAAPPMIIEVNDVFEDELLTDLCGFAVEGRTTGTLIIRSRAGTEDTTAANLQIRLTNRESGTSITLRISGLQRISSTDTSFTFSFSGGSKLVVPGQGAVFIDVGRFVETVTFNAETGEVIAVETVRKGRADAVSDEQICTLLAP